jgi:uncharacterized protein
MAARTRLCHPGLALRVGDKGRTVYTRTGHRAGERLLEHYGERATFAAAAHLAADHIMEVGLNQVFLPSQDIDDYVNHSCEPNCRLDFRPTGRVFLVTLRDVTAGEDLTFDYATTTTHAGTAAFPGWRFTCRCGSVFCRGEVAAAEDLPIERLRYYARVGALAPHVLQLLRRLAMPRAARVIDQMVRPSGAGAK